MATKIAKKFDPAVLQKQIDQHIKAVGKVRDDLQDTLDKLTKLDDCCMRAIDNLEYAREVLSELA